MIRNGLFSEVKDFTDGNILLKCKSDGVTFITNTGLAKLMFVNSMLLISTQTSTRHSQLARKLMNMVQTIAKNDLETIKTINIYLYK
jgi:hypothetical protein